MSAPPMHCFLTSLPGQCVLCCMWPPLSPTLSPCRTVSGSGLVQFELSHGCHVTYAEHVIVNTSISVHSRRGDVELRLLSPQNTESVLLPKRRSDYITKDISNWPFMTVASWGEDPRGEWSMTIHGSVTVSRLELLVFGTADTPVAMKRIPIDQCSPQCQGGCSQKGAAEYCDNCLHYRVKSTRECVEVCPEGTYAKDAVCWPCAPVCLSSAGCFAPLPSKSSSQPVEKVTHVVATSGGHFSPLPSESPPPAVTTTGLPSQPPSCKCRCIHCSVPHCSQCEVAAKCDTCEDGFYLSLYGVCQQCDEGCVRCSGQGECLECSEGAVQCVEIVASNDQMTSALISVAVVGVCSVILVVTGVLIGVIFCKLRHRGAGGRSSMNVKYQNVQKEDETTLEVVLDEEQ